MTILKVPHVERERLQELVFDSMDFLTQNRELVREHRLHDIVYVLVTDCPELLFAYMPNEDGESMIHMACEAAPDKFYPVVFTMEDGKADFHCELTAKVDPDSKMYAAGMMGVANWAFYHYILGPEKAGRPTQLIGKAQKLAKRAGARGSKCIIVDVTKPIAPPPVIVATGHGSPKRYHEFRGHWRQYKNGKRVWVRGGWRGNKELGTIYKTYVAKPKE